MFVFLFCNEEVYPTDQDFIFYGISDFFKYFLFTLL